MMRFNDRTAARARKSMEATGGLGELFLAKDQYGKLVRLQFVLHDDKGFAQQHIWAFPTGTPERRVRRIRDNLVADVLAGRVSSPAVLEALRAAVRKLVEELATEDAKRMLEMA